VVLASVGSAAVAPLVEAQAALLSPALGRDDGLDRLAGWLEARHATSQPGAILGVGWEVELLAGALHPAVVLAIEGLDLMRAEPDGARFLESASVAWRVFDDLDEGFPLPVGPTSPLQEAASSGGVAG
jgi:hypothetical protein